MKRIIISVILLVFLCSCTVTPSKQASASLKRYSAEIYGVFDTVISFTAYCESKGNFEGLYNDVSAEFTVLHKLFDRYNTYSAINNIKTINDNAGKMPVEVDERITELLNFASEMYISTDGIVNVMMGDVFDLWRNSRDNTLPPPSDKELKEAAENADIANLIVNKERSTVFIASGECSIDVGAIAKGFAADKVAEMLEKKKVSNFLINCGNSSIRASGKPQDKDAWNIGIRKPFEINKDDGDEQKLISTVKLIDSAIGTSGDYQNYYQYNGETYHHLIDPQTLYPAKNYRAVTVICDGCAIADALSTAIFIADEEWGNELADMYGARVIRINNSMKVSEYKGEKDNAEL